ncbi:MAG TPA: hypothetical protein VJT74_10830 [Pyrinomonadaceae bacterium]|nr:hypothetical protein [Pyrinomonadaceae bacterium]
MKTLSSEVESEFAKYFVGTPKSIQGDYIEAVVAEDWQAIAKISGKGLNSVTSLSEEMSKARGRLKEVADEREAIVSELKKVYKPLRQRTGWPQSREELAKALKKQGLSPAAIEKQLSLVESMTASTFAKSLRSTSTKTEVLLTRLFSEALTHYAGHYFAGSAAAFNQSVEAGEKSRADLLRYADNIEKKLGEKLKDIYTQLRNGDLEGLAASSADLAQFADAELTEKALAYAASAYLARQGKRASFAETGEQAARMGDVVRMLLFSHVAAKQLSWVSGFSVNSEIVHQWTTPAQKVPFGSPAPRPKAVKISDLARNPRKYDGKRVTVAGVVSDVKIIHLGRKVISRAQLADDRGNSITLALAHIKIDSGGIVPGSYVEIVGDWRRESKEAQGNPALDVDRLNLTAESKESWRAKLQLSMRNVFEPVPHTLNASYSWEPGANGAINPIRYAVFYVQPN